MDETGEENMSKKSIHDGGEKPNMQKKCRLGLCFFGSTLMKKIAQTIIITPMEPHFG